MSAAGNGYLQQPVSRRRVVGFLTGATAAALLGPMWRVGTHARAVGPASATTAEARMQIAAMVALIRRGRVRRLSNGTVVVAGWYLPRRYVSAMKAVNEQSRRV